MVTMLQVVGWSCKKASMCCARSNSWPMGHASNLGYPKLLCYGSLVHYFTPHQNHPKPTIPGLQVARPVEGDTSRVTFSCCEGFTRSTSSPGAMVIGPSRVDNLGSWATQGPGCPKSRYPQIIQVMDDHFSIETHGDLGIAHFENPPRWI